MTPRYVVRVIADYARVIDTHCAGVGRLVATGLSAPAAQRAADRLNAAAVHTAELEARADQFIAEFGLDHGQDCAPAEVDGATQRVGERS